MDLALRSEGQERVSESGQLLLRMFICHTTAAKECFPVIYPQHSMALLAETNTLCQDQDGWYLSPIVLRHPAFTGSIVPQPVISSFEFTMRDIAEIGLMIGADRI
jgi:hypothetical protein